MAKRQKRAAGYIRMSTDDQKDSPDRQRREITELALRENAVIVEWYEDFGLSGTESSKRLAFQRMMSDASQRHFELVLLSEQSRFSREDVYTLFEHLNSLR